MATRSRSIWIDLDNSPHVPLFVPLIRHYRNAGIEVIVTARDHSQTVELLDLAGLSGTFKVVGTHGGGSTIKKLANLGGRIFRLVNLIRRLSKPAVAVSHGSRSMVLAAWILRIPVITMYDYEFTETQIFNRFSDRVLVPDGIDDAVLDRIGLSPDKRHKYPGLKEELYLREYNPDADFGSKLDEAIGTRLDPDRVLVLLRPPATTANYHDPRSDSVFSALVNHLNESAPAFTVVAPRTSEQAAEIAKSLAPLDSNGEKFAILLSAVNGLDLINSADLVISGGGTMNREAVLLGVPVYSIFQGEQGSLDRKMERSGEIIFVRSEADIGKIIVEKRKSAGSKRQITDRVEQFVTKHIDFFVGPGPRS